jgi:hypothetical protein
MEPDSLTFASAVSMTAKRAWGSQRNSAPPQLHPARHSAAQGRRGTGFVNRCEPPSHAREKGRYLSPHAISFLGT